MIGAHHLHDDLQDDVDVPRARSEVAKQLLDERKLGLHHVGARNGLSVSTSRRSSGAEPLLTS